MRDNEVDERVEEKLNFCDNSVSPGLLSTSTQIDPVESPNQAFGDVEFHVSSKLNLRGVFLSK